MGRREIEGNPMYNVLLLRDLLEFHSNRRHFGFAGILSRMGHRVSPIHVTGLVADFF
jgi:hypothetical protein